MTVATMKEEEIMTNQQFDAIIKTVLNTIDLAAQDVTTMRKAILDLLIDNETKQAYQKPLKDRECRAARQNIPLFQSIGVYARATKM